MPSLRQLEFLFDQFGGGLTAGRHAVMGQAPTPAHYQETDIVSVRRHGRDGALEAVARELLCSLGARQISRELRVEWNSRLQTAAGRADYREKLILLNPRLLEHPGEIDRTLRHELAHILAQFRKKGRRRIPPHGPEWRQACGDLGIAGERRCHTLPFPAKQYPPRFIYRCPNCERDFPRVHKIRRTVACLCCCREYADGKFDVRFRLKLLPP